MTPAILLLVAAAAPDQPRRTGTVVYATQRRLYLDAGARDGIARGTVLELRRGGRPAGSCTVETVGETRSICSGSGLPGDVFDVVPPPPLPAPQVKRATPPEPVPVVEERKAAVTSATFERVDFHGGPEIGAGTRAEVTIAHASWAAVGVGPWHQERADVALRDARLGGGFTLDVDLSARRWTLRSDPVSFRPDDRDQLYVWEAAISRRAQEGGFAMSVGRVRPRYVPGQVIFDGAEAGWRTAGGSEVGVFGGAVPDDVTLAPSLEHGTFGAFWSGQHAGDPDSVVRVFRHEARVAFVNTASLGKRVEGEALFQLFLTRWFDAAAAVRGGRREREGTGSLDAVRLDANLGPFDGLSLSGGYRYDGLSIPELDGPGNVRFGGAARHADLSAEWQPGDVLRIAVVSGVATDLTVDQTRRWIGPEVGTRLFAGNASVAVGYLEEQGWAQGRSAYLQIVGGARSRVQAVARFSWFHTITGLSPEPTDDLAGFFSIRARIAGDVSLRLAATGRSSLNGGRIALGTPSAQAGWLDAALDGQF